MNMKTINAKIVADSINEEGDRITSFILQYPRMIHSELMTHRMFSRNAASSRALPFKTMLKMVEEDPFIPIAWQTHHTGMQGTKYLTDTVEKQAAINSWLNARDEAVKAAKTLYQHNDITKQLCNRLLEPFLWYTVLVTATEYDNFFDLRLPKYATPVSQTVKPMYSRREVIENHSNPDNLALIDKFKEEDWWKLSESGAEIHIQALAEAMYEAMHKSKPALLRDGEWHIPFGDTLNQKEMDKLAYITLKDQNSSGTLTELAVATARCARISYLTFDKKLDYVKDVQLHDTLLKSKHMSPFEHCARAMTIDEYEQFGHNFAYLKGKGCYYKKGWCKNFKGFISYRHMLEHNVDV